MPQKCTNPYFQHQLASSNKHASLCANPLQCLHLPATPYTKHQKQTVSLLLSSKVAMWEVQGHTMGMWFLSFPLPNICHLYRVVAVQTSRVYCRQQEAQEYLLEMY